MNLKLTVEDSIVCVPDTTVISLNYFDKKPTISELERGLDTFVKFLKETIRSSKGLDLSKLEIGSFHFKKSFKSAMVESVNESGNGSQIKKVKEDVPDGHTLSCNIKYVDSIGNEGVFDFYENLVESQPYSISMSFECKTLEDYKNKLLKNLIEKGGLKAKLIANEYGFKRIHLKNVDYSATASNSMFNGYSTSNSCYERGISSFVEGTNKRGIELRDSITVEYEIS